MFVTIDTLIQSPYIADTHTHTHTQHKQRRNIEQKIIAVAVSIGLAVDCLHFSKVVAIFNPQSQFNTQI